MSEKRLSKTGFPIGTCGRCGGSGEFGPKSIEAGRCFSCVGSGVVIVGKNAKAEWYAYQEARRRQSRPQIGQVQPGERVAPYGTAEFFTVERVEVNREHAMGWSLSTVEGVEVRTACGWEAVVIGTEGERIKGATNSICRRAGKVNPEPFAARARMTPAAYRKAVAA